MGLWGDGDTSVWDMIFSLESGRPLTSEALPRRSLQQAPHLRTLPLELPTPSAAVQTTGMVLLERAGAGSGSGNGGASLGPGLPLTPPPPPPQMVRVTHTHGRD